LAHSLQVRALPHADETLEAEADLIADLKTGLAEISG